jgi:restriction system protein
MPELLTEVVEVSTEINYWFFRTEGGDYFESFLNNDYIAIGWNNVLLRDIRNKTNIEVKSIIERVENIKTEGRTKKHKLTDIYNKIWRFENFKKGDIIIIPSASSHELVFGEIMDDRAFEAPSGTHDCPFEKRRHVQWLTPITPLSSLDPTFDKLRRPRHTIVNVSEYDYYIDSVIHSVYTKNGSSHLVVKVLQQEEINLKDLAEILVGIQEIMEIVNEEFHLNENIDDTTIKIYLQSPGLFNIKNLGKSLVLTAMILGSASCSSDEQPQATQQIIEKVRHENPDKIDTLTTKMQNMHINF